MIALVALSTGIELSVAGVLTFAAILGYGFWDYRRLCKRSIKEELEATEADAWAGFKVARERHGQPQRFVGPPGRKRLP
jgi:hypothetical protein